MTAAAPPSSLFSIFTGLFVAVLVICTVISSKVFAVGPFTMPGGVILFPLVFAFNDILTEVYGYERSRRVIWTGLFCQALAGLSFYIVDLLPPAGFWPNQAAYHTLLGFAPRVAFASLIAYFCGEFANSALLSKMKYWQAGARGVKLGWRFLASTIVGEAVNTLIFITFAFSGVMALHNMLRTAATLYVAKVLYEVIILPPHMRLANWVKKVEGIDQIDLPESTNYSPFTGVISK